MSGSPFHAGEQRVQERLGVREAIEPWARQVVRPYLPAQHRDFYAQLPFVVAAARDGTGRPWATLLAGRPGFVTSPDDRSLLIGAGPAAGDALAGAIVPGAQLGLLGIELDTRRRNRVNGTVAASGAAGLRFEVGQAFGNCPQYITERRWRAVAVDPAGVRTTRHQRLNARLRAWIESADTMFVASGYRGEEDGDPALGMDASHRGGPPGFVRVTGDRRLTFPDYAGNNHFNTIGNLVADPRIGLLFVDFERGSLLQLSGTATIDWEPPPAARRAGARRTIDVVVEAAVELDAVLPLRWGGRADMITTLRLKRRYRESDDVTSFEFVAADGSDLPPFEPGQHLPIELPVGGRSEPVRRSYSLSNGPDDGHYRISVKRHPHGLASRLLHDTLEAGALVAARPPAGDFVLRCGDRPVVLVSAGVGITPLLSMLGRRCPGQPVLFVHGARDGDHHPFASELRRLAEADPQVTLHTSYSRPGPQDVPGRDFDRVGRVDAELIAALLPDLDADFYLCGPVGFMASVSAGLVRRGATPDRIHTESFGPAAP